MRKRSLNCKGFSIIELLLSFALVMVLILSMFGAVFSFKNKEQNSSIRNSLITYKNSLTKAISDDVVKYKVSDIKVDDPNRSITITFVDGTTSIIETNSRDGIISYKGRNDTESIRYPLPNIENVYLGERVGNVAYFKEVRYLASTMVNGSNHSVAMARIDIPIHHPDFTEDFGIHMIVVSDSGTIVNLEDVIYNFDYIGDVQEFIAPDNGTYQIELWGAAGGGPSWSGQGGVENHYLGGNGAYTKGVITLQKDEKLYIYVGQKGTFGELSDTPIHSYNGGGSYGIGVFGTGGAGTTGGGATDVRLSGGAWDDFDSLKSRIMIAAGGGGSGYHGFGIGGAGGALTGINGVGSRAGTGGSQNAGGVNGASVQYKSDVIGRFGVGGDGSPTTTYSFEEKVNEIATLYYGSGGGGGGGGYFGGGSGGSGGNKTDDGGGSGGGGSSYISGYTGCNSIAESSTASNLVFTNQANHYSGKTFTNTVMTAGNEDMPNPRGVGDITGNGLDGYARITWLR